MYLLRFNKYMLFIIAHLHFAVKGFFYGGIANQNQVTTLKVKVADPCRVLLLKSDCRVVACIVNLHT